MNKKKIKDFSFKFYSALKLCAILCLPCALLCSCGLDTFYTTPSPTNAIHTPHYNNNDFAGLYFEFETPSYNLASAEYTFLGTAVYYRIYVNASEMLQVNNVISSLNTESNYDAAAKKMIDYYKYVPLGTSNGTPQALIEDQSATKVKIRLMNYNNDYKAEILKNGSYFDTPRRKSYEYSFDFGRGDSSNYVNKTKYNNPPSSSDEDFSSSASWTESGVYYVDLYAVSLGRDKTFSTSYSNVLHLGAVPIDSKKENN